MVYKKLIKNENTFYLFIDFIKKKKIIFTLLYYLLINREYSKSMTHKLHKT